MLSEKIVNLGENDVWACWKQARSYVWKEFSPEATGLSLSIYISLSSFEILGSEFRPNLLSYFLNNSSWSED